MTELNVELKSDSTKDCILIYKNKTSEERILLHEDAKPSEENTKKRTSELLVANLIKHIKSPYEDPRESLIHHLMRTFEFKNKTVDCSRKLDESADKYLLDIMATFDKVYVSNFGNIDWVVRKEDIQVFCKRIKDLYISLKLKEGENRFKFDEALECEKLWIHDDSSWLDIENLLTRETKMTQLQLYDVTDQDVNNIFIQWINGNATNVLSYVWFFVKNPTSDIVIFKDIAAKEIT
ncbi:hypothetical protein B9Z55_023523 [Caenorhabditis nigoni]|uniref:F-box associated domain-containing protein n=1 Tax=Caenorhabditis nigoni TaxID=1611254 RepID=A0A2G5SQ17_9PELO|nr:hypothetical protein B9Z55_023523 [Caenorhabditis nigoni]